MLLDDPPEVERRHSDEALILEPQHELGLPWAPARDAIGAPLVQKRRFPAAAHPDNGEGLTRNSG
jgi:hypothetical protein